jgi:transcriptional regulator NrdR family protein
MTECPNCGEKRESQFIDAQERKHIAACFGKRKYCLKCGYKFSSYIEKRYATKNL